MNTILHRPSWAREGVFWTYQDNQGEKKLYRFEADETGDLHLQEFSVTGDTIKTGTVFLQGDNFYVPVDTASRGFLVYKGQKRSFEEEIVETPFDARDAYLILIEEDEQCGMCRAGRCYYCKGRGKLSRKLGGFCDACDGTGECKFCDGKGNYPVKDYFWFEKKTGVLLKEEHREIRPGYENEALSFRFLEGANISELVEQVSAEAADPRHREDADVFESRFGDATTGSLESGIPRITGDEKDTPFIAIPVSTEPLLDVPAIMSDFEEEESGAQAEELPEDSPGLSDRDVEATGVPFRIPVVDPMKAFEATPADDDGTGVSPAAATSEETPFARPGSDTFVDTFATKEEDAAPLPGDLAGTTETLVTSQHDAPLKSEMGIYGEVSPTSPGIEEIGDAKDEVCDFSMCPYCGRDFKFLKPPSFCPYCREKLTV